MGKSAWGSRPNNFEKKLVGIVKIVTGKEKAKLTLQEDGKQFKNGTDTMTFPIASLPKRPKLKLDDKTGTEYRIRMNPDGTDVEAIMPVRGQFKAKLKDIGPRPEKDADPVPQVKTFTKGDVENSHLEFFAVYEIQEGHFKGVQLPAYNLHYKFEEDPENEGYTRFAGSFENKKATRLFQLRDWVVTHQLDNDLIEWDDETILPALLERGLENDVEVLVTLDKGYIILVQPQENYEDEDFENEVDVEDDDVDKDFPPAKVEKKLTRKPIKKSSKKTEDDEDDL